MCLKGASVRTLDTSAANPPPTRPRDTAEPAIRDTAHNTSLPATINSVQTTNPGATRVQDSKLIGSSTTQQMESVSVVKVYSLTKRGPHSRSM